MAQNFIYGIGGYCENCYPEQHGHPLHNLISVEEIPDLEPAPRNSDIEQIANSLASLSPESLNALKIALGI